MKIKFTLTAGLLALPLLAVNLHAQTWDPSANPTQPSDGLWDDPANWTGDAVPGSAVEAQFSLSGETTSAVVTDAETVGQVVIGLGAGAGSVIITNGGSLGVSDPQWTAVGYNNYGYLEVDAGGSFTTPDVFWIGNQVGGSGTMNLNGGTVTVANMFGMDFYQLGAGPNVLNVNGGTMTVGAWSAAQSVYGNSKINLAGGTFMIAGDHTATGDGSIPALITSGKIVAYGGAGIVNASFAAGYTTLTGTPPSGGGSPSQITYFAVSGGQVTVIYSATIGATYHVESTASLSPPSWSTVAGSPTNNVTGSNVTFTSPVPGARQYYRVVSP